MPESVEVEEEETTEEEEVNPLVDVFGPIIGGEIFKSELVDLIAWRETTGDLLKTIQTFTKMFDADMQKRRAIDPESFKGVAYFRNPRTVKDDAQKLLDSLKI